MNILQSALDSAIQDILSDDAYDGSTEEEIISAIDGSMSGIVETTVHSLLSTIKSEADAELKDETEYRQQFEQRLEKHWQKPLTLLELLIALALEAGSDFNDAFRQDAVGSNDARFEALVRNHARASQVASEVLTLLRSGYADGAHARWRTLHEIAVTSMFISDASQVVAEKYLLHEVVQQYKKALQYQRYQGRLNVEPITQAEIDKMKVQHDKLIARFGKSFKKDYGWAASALGKERPTFADIEDSVDMEHWRPYYGMASGNTHANSHGARFRLGLSPENDGKVLLAGPSDAGLADPGHSTAISLGHVTIALLKTAEVNFDRLVIIQMLMNLTDEIGDAFLQAHKELEERSSKGV